MLRTVPGACYSCQRYNTIRVVGPPLSWAGDNHSARELHVEPSSAENRPLIEYPCSWDYKAIGWDEGSMREAIAEIMADRPHEVSFSRRSRAGRYCSLLLVVTVESEDQRNAIFAALKAHRHIRMVL